MKVRFNRQVKPENKKTGSSSISKNQKVATQIIVCPTGIVREAEYSFSFPIIQIDMGRFVLKLQKVVKAKYLMSDEEAQKLLNVGITQTNIFKINFNVAYNAVSSILENYKFSFHLGSWGSLNYNYSTTIGKTIFSLGYTMQLINIFANDSVHISAITKVNKYIEVEDNMSAELNRFLAAALIVSATVAIPVMAIEIAGTLLGMSEFISQLVPKLVH